MVAEVANTEAHRDKDTPSCARCTRVRLATWAVSSLRVIRNKHQSFRSFYTPRSQTSTTKQPALDAWYTVHVVGVANTKAYRQKASGRTHRLALGVLALGLRHELPHEPDDRCQREPVEGKVERLVEYEVALEEVAAQSREHDEAGLRDEGHHQQHCVAESAKKRATETIKWAFEMTGTSIWSLYTDTDTVKMCQSFQHLSFLLYDCLKYARGDYTQGHMGNFKDHHACGNTINITLIQWSQQKHAMYAFTSTLCKALYA